MNPSNSQSPLQRYWSNIRRLEKQFTESHLDGCVYVATIADEMSNPPLPGGVVSKASPFLAAKCLVDKTHTVATPEQIAGYEQMHAERAQVIAAAAGRDSNAITFSR